MSQNKKRVMIGCHNEDIEDHYVVCRMAIGYDTLSNSVVVRWFKIGGDWEVPVGVCLYARDRNVYNKKLKSAYGNNDDGEDYIEDEFDMDAMRTAAAKRFFQELKC